jgi:hypothetical protein
MFPAATVDVETEGVGTGASAGSPAGVDGTPGADVAGSGDDEDGGLLGAFVGLGVFFGLGVLAGTAVTVTMPVACAVIDGFVATSAEAVRETHAVPLDGVPIWAWRVNDDGVTSVPIGPSWHEAVPSPVGHKPENAAWPADAASVTDTSGAAPFSTWTWTANPAARPASTLDLDGRTLRHNSTGRSVGDIEGDTAGDGVGASEGDAVGSAGDGVGAAGDGVGAAAGNGRHCEAPSEAPAVGA